MNSKQSSYLSIFCNPPDLKEIISDASLVDMTYDNEIKHWKSGKYKIKALVLGEAPLIPEKYFYSGNTGNFLSLLKAKYGQLSGSAFLQVLRIKGIFVMDIYEFPIPSKCYAKDTQAVLFDPQYVKDKIDRLFKDGLLDSHMLLTVPRYGMLVKRGILSNGAFARINKFFVTSTVGSIEPLGTGANSMTLNPMVSLLLPP